MKTKSYLNSQYVQFFNRTIERWDCFADEKFIFTSLKTPWNTSIEELRRKIRTVKIPYGDKSIRRKFRTAKFPYGEKSWRLKFHTAKTPYGEKSWERKILPKKIPTAKIPATWFFITTLFRNQLNFFIQKFYTTNLKPIRNLIYFF